MSTSNFSRYVSALEVLHPHIQEICRASIENRTEIRAWVAGCATGEQAYVLAMLLDEALAGEEHPPLLQVFATDIEEQALAIARQGRYPTTAVEHLSRARIDRYFFSCDQGYAVGKRLRDSVAFAHHNLVSDSPFLRMNLIICRNILHRFDEKRQENALQRVHFALKSHGLLLLGDHENVGDSGGLFLPVNPRRPVFRKQGNAAAPASSSSTSPSVSVNARHSRSLEARAFSEELEAANDELHAINKELMALNEELNAKSAEIQALNDVGDELLTQIANRLSAQMREMDTVARLGGDEFTIVLSETSFTGAEQVAGRIVRALRLPVEVRSQKLFVSASMGLAFYPDDGETPQALTKAADTAMYRAKANGRDRFELYKPELQAQMLKQSRLESALREALQSDQLRLVFQPKFTAGEHRKMIGAEALLRWHNPELGSMSPADFIPAAETSGLIKDIDRKVIGIAVQALSYWRARDMKPVPVALNISARSFQDEHFPDFLARAMKQYQVPAELIQVEITEGTLVERTSTAQGNIEKLRNAGIPLSVDDFGTGYSSLSYLKRLPLAELKIDKSFVDGLGGKDKNDEAIAKAILAMATALNLRTVAEGVETEEQQQWLSANGCDYLQGFLYSHPLEYRAFTEILQNGNQPWP